MARLGLGKRIGFASIPLLVLLLWGIDRNRIIWGQRLQREGRP